ncbi:MAG TPA: MOSC domain-containing protein, partial [Steroidobacteraceae bacterium]|nr:MOSC domain-containing protein [Steroidobacteraceae bacterium]
VTYVDGFPILVCNRASLAELNTRLPTAIPMTRFRPNLVLEGLPAFAEDWIDTLDLGEVKLRLVKPCTRCVITSTDQQTGERLTNPLPVLRQYRFSRELMGVMFGENAVIAAGVGARIAEGAVLIARADR